MHILSDEEHRLIAFKVCHFLKEERPFLPSEEYIRNKKARMMFDIWFEENEKSLKNEVIKDEKEIKEVSSIFESDADHVDRNVVRKRVLDQLGKKLENFSGEKDNLYFLNNFYDPLDIKM